MKVNVFLFLESGTLTRLPKEVSRNKHGLKTEYTFRKPLSDDKTNPFSASSSGTLQ